MARTLGQPVIIENAVGAAGTLAGQRLISSPPDGHTILIGHTGTHAASVALNPNLRYKPVEDFAHVGLVNTNPIFVNTRKSLPVNNLRELVDCSRPTRPPPTMPTRHRLGEPHDLPALQFRDRREDERHSLSRHGPRHE